MIDIPLQQLHSKLQTKRTADRETLLYDIVRKRYVVMQPEEVVRQLLIHYLVEVGTYPLGRIQIEKGVTTAGRKGRFDVVVYDKHVCPWMLIECKSHKVPLTQSTFDQLGGYNTALNAPYHMVSNGIHTYCYKKSTTEQKYIILDSLPAYVR